MNDGSYMRAVPRCLCSLTIYCRSCVCSHTQHNKHWLSEVKVSGKFSSQTVMGQRLRDERVDTGTSSGRRLDGRQSSFYVGIKCLERKQRGWYESVDGGQNSMEKGGQVYKAWSRGLVMDKGWRTRIEDVGQRTLRFDWRQINWEGSRWGLTKVWSPQKTKKDRRQRRQETEDIGRMMDVWGKNKGVHRGVLGE